MNLLRGKFVAAACAAVLAVGLGACGGGEDTGEPLDPLEPSMSSIKEHIFTSGCAFSACHDSSAPASGLDLTGNAHGSLVGRMSSMSAGGMLVVAGDPDSSFLIKKLRGPLGEG